VNFDKYVGLQYGFKGRGPTYDCYGLVILVYREMAALELPSFAESYTSDDDRRELNALISNQLTPWIEIPWGQERPLDCVLMREGRCIRHICMSRKPTKARSKGTAKAPSGARSLDSTATKKSKRVGAKEAAEPVKPTPHVEPKKPDRDPTFPPPQEVAVVNPPVQGEVLPPAEEVRVIGSAHPLRLSRTDHYVRAGLNIEEIVDEVQRRHGHKLIPSGLRVFVNGESVPEDMWKSVRLKPGATMTFYTVAEKNAMRSIGMIAIAIAAIALPMLAAPLFAGLGTFGAAIASGVLGAAVSLGGMMAMNALFPVAKPKLADQQDKGEGQRKMTHSIGGGRNEADPFGPIPVIFGKHRFSPNYGAQPYTELNGDDQYLRMLFIWGYGKLDISTIKIGETAIGTFEGVDIQTYSGVVGDPQPTLYPTEVIQEDLNIELVAESEWMTRTTATGINQISVDFAAPQGIYIYDDERTGERNSLDVQVQIEYRAVGAGSWSSVQYVSFKERTPDVIRRGQSWGVAVGQYEVRVRNVGEEYSEDVNVANLIMWTAIRGFRSGSPIRTAKPVAYTAVRIKASGQLNGSIDTLNGIVEARGKAYNGTTWNLDQESSNPADCFVQCLQHPANVKALPDSMIDWDSLADWWHYCNGDNWKFNMVQDFRSSVYETLVDIAAAGRAAPIVRDGKWGVVWDDPTAPIVQHFTPRNSWGFSSTRAYRAYPHGWRIRFLNEDKGYVQDERIVYDDGYGPHNATRFESIEFPGVTDPDLIWKHGRYHIAQARLRPETYTLSVDMEHLACTRGDRVRVTHDVPMWGLHSARVTSVAGSTIGLDETIFMETGKTYSVRFRLADGSSALRTVTTVDGEYDSITLSGSGTSPVVGDLAMFGETNSESVVLRVQTIRPQPDFVAQLTLVDDAPAIYDADITEIPPFDSQITEPVDPLTVGPTDVRIRESIYKEGTDFVSAVRVSWTVVRYGITSAFEVQLKDDSAGGAWRTVGTVPAPMTSYEILNLPSGYYSFRVRALFSNGTASGWTSLLAHEILGLMQPPANVDSFKLAVIGDLTTLTWDPVGAVNLSHYEVRHSVITDGSVTWGAALPVVLQAQNTLVQVPTRPGTYLVKAVTAQGVYSVNPAIIITTLESLETLNVVETLEEAPLFQTRDAQDINVAFGVLRLAAETGSSEPNVVKPRGVYTFFQNVDLGAVYTSRVTARIEAGGETTTNVMSAWANLADLAALEEADPDNWEVTMQIRTTDDNPDGGDNYLTVSLDINHANWGKYHTTVVNDAGGSFFGPADYLKEDSATDEHSLYVAVARPRNEPHCFSFFVYADTLRHATLWIRDDSNTTGGRAHFNLDTFEAEWTDTTGTGVVHDYGIERWRYNWCRVWISVTPKPADSGLGIQCLLVLGDTIVQGGSTVYAGNTSKGLYVGGAQLERGTIPSRYKDNTSTSAAIIGTDLAPVWSEWEDLVVGDYKARGMEFRAILEGLADNTASPPYAVTTPAISGLSVSVDMPDRIESLKDVYVGTLGATITFDPPFKFLKSVTFGHQNLAPGDYAQILNKDEGGFEIYFRNSSNVLIARTTDIQAVGYGIEV
jgi:hypothetical protein